MAERIDLFRRALAGRGAGDRQGSRSRGRVRLRQSRRRRARPRACPRRARRSKPKLVAEARGRRGLRRAPPALSRSRAPCPASRRRISTPAACSMRSRRRGSRRSARGRWAECATISRHLTEARVRGDAIVRARTAEEVPLVDRGRADRSRAADRRSAARGRACRAEAGRAWIEEKAAAELDALALTLDDQAAFASCRAGCSRISTWPRPKTRRRRAAGGRR